ncbi:hypothetical protein [Rhodocista pekingensis]|uniref:Polymerase nucleotidyl transferase domain-containing protein n=1 Tax=Rhodocista pekingensis TaxID=201185 RepID=A0ABW2KQZ5_9PROT
MNERVVLNEIKKRREYTLTRTSDLKNKLSGANALLGNVACIYATGSFGRLEASSRSDLDLFIVARSQEDQEDEKGIKKSQLKRLDEICIKADLIKAIRELNIPDFDGDGKYLGHYSVDAFVKTLGAPDDDSTNALTGRLLLFLESRPLLGNSVYSDVISDVTAAYWRDYEDHKENFAPAFLANDILRLWRTFCVNYEARRKTIPEKNKISGKVKNYKLKHSRMLTCYSALLYLLAIFKENGTVSPKDAIKMTEKTPTERLEFLLTVDGIRESRDTIERLLIQYDKFLVNTGESETPLEERFEDRESFHNLMSDSKLFGELMFDAMQKIGRESELFRLMVV